VAAAEAIGPGDQAPDVPQKDGRKPDRYTDRLLKYIPTEVVVLYVSLDSIIRKAPPQIRRGVVLWVVFVSLLIGTWFYLARVEHVTKRQQLFISTVGFAIWVFSLGGPFESLSWYSPFYGAVLLPLYTFGISLVKAEAT
jgi:hypothetical protein